MMNKLLKWATLGVWGGYVYMLIEVVYKSLTGASAQIHWSMMITGSIVFLVVGAINQNVLRRGMPLWKQCLIAAIAILVIEFLVGLLVNRLLGWNVWYYDKWHIMHQICLPFAFLWYWLSLVAIWLDDKLREKLFGETKHTYRVF